CTERSSSSLRCVLAAQAASREVETLSQSLFAPPCTPPNVVPEVFHALGYVLTEASSPPLDQPSRLVAGLRGEQEGESGTDGDAKHEAGSEHCSSRTVALHFDLLRFHIVCVIRSRIRHVRLRCLWVAVVGR